MAVFSRPGAATVTAPSTKASFFASHHFGYLPVITLTSLRSVFVLNPPLLRPIAWHSPLFYGLRHYAGAPGQSSSRSWHIRYLCPAITVQRHVSRRRFCSSVYDGYVWHGNHRTVPAGHARQFQHGSGTAPLQQTGGYPWP